MKAKLTLNIGKKNKPAKIPNTISAASFIKEDPKSQTQPTQKPQVKLCEFCLKVSKDVCIDQNMASVCSNLLDKKDYFVWRETTEAKEGQPVGAWDYATNVATTRIIAQAICKLLETEHPVENFTVSSSRPKSFYL